MKKSRLFPRDLPLSPILKARIWHVHQRICTQEKSKVEQGKAESGNRPPEKEELLNE